MNDVIYEGNQDIFNEATEKGFFVLKNFFKREAVVKVREELVKILNVDLEYRKSQKISKAVLNYKEIISEIKTSHIGTSTLTEYMHDYLFPSFQSEIFANLVEQLFLNPVIDNFIQKAIGPNRLRVDLFRQATGIDDYVDKLELPHRWHRDSPGEFTFGFFLDDMDIPQSGCTAVVPGTHWSSYSPLWDLIFSPRNNYTSYEDFVKNNMNYRYFPQIFFPCAVFNKILRKNIQNQIVEISGRIGDIFFFFNNIWHGRAPNRTGKKFMLSRIGGFASGFKFKDDLPLPGSLESLPTQLAKYYSEKILEPNADLLIHQIHKNPKDSLLLDMAAYEKKFFNRLANYLDI